MRPLRLPRSSYVWRRSKALVPMSPNRFTSWPLWVSLAVVVVSLVSAAWPLLLLPALPFVLCALGLGVWAAWGGGMALCRGQWRRAISMIALPLAIIAA